MLPLHNYESVLPILPAVWPESFGRFRTEDKGRVLDAVWRFLEPVEQQLVAADIVEFFGNATREDRMRINEDAARFLAGHAGGAGEAASSETTAASAAPSASGGGARSSTAAIGSPRLAATLATLAREGAHSGSAAASSISEGRRPAAGGAGGGPAEADVSPPALPSLPRSR